MRAGLILAAGGVLMAVLAAPAQDQGTFKDPRDGRVYGTVTIGAQTWMAENLAFKAKGGCHAYGWDADNKKANVAKYGYLYEWNAAKKACPPGWHLPTKEEWETLIAHLGGELAAGAAMKSQTGWGTADPAEDRFGFSALPGGYLADMSKSSFYDLGEQAMWWTATESDRYTAWTMHVFVGGPQIDRGTYGKSAGGALSVRCVKD
jgi:uncharacterized protein (TIGR02145 family)